MRRLQAEAEPNVREKMNINLLAIRYASWGVLLTLCIAMFWNGFNINRYFSIPIEVFAIVLASLLVVSAYLLQLKNKYFMVFLWLGVLASTISFVWFVLIHIAHPFGTETTAMLYALSGLFVCWLYFKK